MNRHDVVVVGAGLAGLTAATRLAEAGARVAVLAKGVGATHLGPCTIDALGYDPEPVDQPGEAIRRLAETRPSHPYALAGPDALRAGIAWLIETVGSGPLAPYTYTGGLDENLRLPTAVGVLKPSAAVPETMAAGDLREGGTVSVAGFRTLKDFHPALLADNLTRHEGIEASAMELDLAPEGRADANALAFARAFDDAAFRSRVAAELARRLGRADRVALPAVLGIKRPHEVWSDLAAKVGRPVFEVPTLPPSVPGMRVFATLRERLRRAGAPVVLNAVVHGADTDGDRVTAVRVRTGLRDVVHQADWVVLATGGFASGGVELDARWRARETALGLPVAGVPEPGEERFRPEYFGRQPMGRAGVAADAQLRPLDPGGARLHDNVLVCGATLAGAEPWREKSGDGISLATGWRAAELIIEQGATGSRAAAGAVGGRG
jgi:glycerol-3-phosphate dehydrogenase subunit B